MKSEVPTSLETAPDLIGHLVAASVSLCGRCSALARPYNLAVAAADHRELDGPGRSGAVLVAAAVKGLRVCGHHSEIV